MDLSEIHPTQESVETQTLARIKNSSFESPLHKNFYNNNICVCFVMISLHWYDI